MIKLEHDNSWRFDCFCFILSYKLIDILEKIIWVYNGKINILKNFDLNIRCLNNDIYEKGFFEYYKNLTVDYFNIKNNLDNLKIFDNINTAFRILDNYDDLKILYFITEKCLRCWTYVKTCKKILIYIMFW